jgi:hypothetical protein
MFKSVTLTAAALLGVAYVYAYSYSQAADAEPQATVDQTVDTWRLHLTADIQRLTAVSYDPI